MSYNGFEIDMLNVGDADCFLTTQWTNDVPTRVLIDGGNVSSFQTLQRFLTTQSISYIDHVVCTHPHDDHAGGLIELIKSGEFNIGKVWIHVPEYHVDLVKVELALNQLHGLKRVKLIQESIETAYSLIELCIRNGITIEEPFSPKQIGCLKIVGPTETYYTELLAQFSDSTKIKASEALLNECENNELAELLLERAGQPESNVLQSNPQTSPENNSSVILATVQNGNKYLFTGDAGAQALTLASTAFELSNCHWMQIPHHGSRRNITETLITAFSPKVAFVSAKGSRKHPRRAVVNAFKKINAKVFSTHYPDPAPKRHHCGVVPERTGYISATPLWDAIS